MDGSIVEEIDRSGYVQRQCVDESKALSEPGLSQCRCQNLPPTHAEERGRRRSHRWWRAQGAEVCVIDYGEWRTRLLESKSSAVAGWQVFPDMRRGASRLGSRQNARRGERKQLGKLVV